MSELDNLSSQILGLAFSWADAVENAPDSARVRIAAARFRKTMQYILKHGEVPPEGWRPDNAQFSPLDIYLFEKHYPRHGRFSRTNGDAERDFNAEEHTLGIAGPGVETETWKGFTPP